MLHAERGHTGLYPWLAFGSILGVRSTLESLHFLGQLLDILPHLNAAACESAAMAKTKAMGAKNDNTSILTNSLSRRIRGCLMLHVERGSHLPVKVSSRHDDHAQGDDEGDANERCKVSSL